MSFRQTAPDGQKEKRPLRLERRGEALAPRPHFLRRQVAYTMLATAILAGALGIGMAGFHVTERQPWLDAFLNAAMLLGGMGPIGDPPQTAGGKLFAGTYALFAGVVFLLAAGAVVTPIFHRILHHFHLEADEPFRE